MNPDKRRERLVVRLAVAGLCSLVALNVLGTLGGADPAIAAQAEKYPAPFIVVLLLTGLDLVALWIVALRTLATDPDLPSFVRRHWIVPVAVFGMITGPVFLIWRWRRYVRWLPET